MNLVRIQWHTIAAGITWRMTKKPSFFIVDINGVIHPALITMVRSEESRPFRKNNLNKDKRRIYSTKKIWDEFFFKFYFQKFARVNYGNYRVCVCCVQMIWVYLKIVWLEWMNVVEWMKKGWRLKLQATKSKNNSHNWDLIHRSKNSITIKKIRWKRSFLLVFHSFTKLA